VGFRVHWGGGFHRDPQGQTLVVIALAVTVLLGAVALGVDAGYGLTQRRVMQNAADAAAIGAGKLLASSVISTPSGTLFAASGDAVYCRAWKFTPQNPQAPQTFRPDAAGRTDLLTVQWSSNLSALNPWAPPAGGTFAAPSNPAVLCQNSLITSGASVSANTRFIRVEVGVTYRSLIARAVTSTASLQAGAHAVVALSGASVPDNGPTWPITRHYTRDMFNETCGTPCNPTSAVPVLFWSSGSNTPDVDFGTFHGMVDYSRYSLLVENGNGSCYGTPLPSTCVSQLITHWDNSGPPSSPLPNLAAVGNSQVNCSPDNAKWITWGDDIGATTGKVSGDDTGCSVPNWATKPFGNDPTSVNTGQLRVDTARGPLVDPGSLRISACSPANLPPPPLETPSCANPDLGDWIETQGGNTGNKLSQPLLAYISANGTTDDWSNVICTSCSGNPAYGKHITVLVYLWDCAQTYTGSNTWALVEPKTKPSTDCSDIHKNSDLGGGQNVNRIHLFTIAPFTFYEGLVSASAIEGFWGGLVSSGDGGCGCVLNTFSNSVELVPDQGE
jgi:Flp pilus assembly protein TadG